jgi:hypothetical protein
MTLSLMNNNNEVKEQELIIIESILSYTFLYLLCGKEQIFHFYNGIHIIRTQRNYSMSISKDRTSLLDLVLFITIDLL